MNPIVQNFFGEDVTVTKVATPKNGPAKYRTISAGRLASLERRAEKTARRRTWQKRRQEFIRNRYAAWLKGGK